MRRIYLLLVVLSVFISFRSTAQFRYVVTTTTRPYTPLVGAASLNNGIIWTYETFSTPLPFVWYIDSSIAVTHFNIAMTWPTVMADTTDLRHVNGFMIGNVATTDRGSLTMSQSLSPIRYQTTGVAPDRIFKVELSNAGLYNEKALSGTLNDFINMQLWIYEGLDAFEIHFGPSQITNPSVQYNFGDTGPFLAYAKDNDYGSAQYGTYYHLTGATNKPGIDSVKHPSTPVGKLQGWPVNGQVYRFTPRHKYVPSTKISTVPSSVFARVAPSFVGQTLNIYNDENHALKCDILSVTGKLLWFQEIHSGKTELDLSKFPAGAYFVRMSDNKSQPKTFKVVKQ